MPAIVKSAAFVTAAMLAALAAEPAAAQALLTRMSINGTDSGSCAISPCRTLQYTASQTLPNGRILCLEGGDYGSVTITRTLTVDCVGNAAASSEIVIDDSATASPGTITVVIRGLSIEGGGIFRSGIRFISGFSLAVENVAIANVAGANGVGGGIEFAPNRAARLLVANSSIANVLGPGIAGISIRPTGPGYASVVLENVLLSGNRIGLAVDLGSSTASSSTNVVINRSLVAGSAGNGVSVSALAGTPGAGVTISNSTINGNNLAGIFATGPLASVRVVNSTIAGNSTGVQPASGAIIATYGNNTLIGNGVNGSFNGFPTEN